MTNDGRSIGELARASGLTVSALRFYDAAGVLPPAEVDPYTGYRRYRADQIRQARLIAHLRRVRMPVVEITEVLAALDTPDRAARLIAAHHDRLERSLADARHHLAAAHALLIERPPTMTYLTTSGQNLLAALSAVRFAVSHHPDLPALGGVLFDYDGAALTLVASDRYRLSVAAVAVHDADGPAVQVIAPANWLDDLDLDPGADVGIRLDAGSIAVDGQQTEPVDAEFPAYRTLLPAAAVDGARLSARTLRDRLRDAPVKIVRRTDDDVDTEVVALVPGTAGVDVADHEHPEAVGLNREFLLDALAATASDQLVLSLDGPTRPLILSDPARPADLHLLMPTLLT